MKQWDDLPGIKYEENIQCLKSPQFFFRCDLKAYAEKNVIGELIFLFGNLQLIDLLPKTPELFQICDFISYSKKNFLEIPRGTIGFITNLDVVSDFRRKKIGLHLITAAEQITKKNHITASYALVIKNDEIARGFWNFLTKTSNWELESYIFVMMKIYRKMF